VSGQPQGSGAALLASTREAMDAAATAYAEAESRMEGGLLSGDPERRRAVCDDLDRAATVLAHTRRDWLDALRREAPSFEDLLADPTTQLDAEGVVLRSILAYEEKTRCLERIEVTTATASVGGFQVPSRYVCMKPKPCPDHAQGESRG
jgi:hypothetical protein